MKNKLLLFLLIWSTNTLGLSAREAREMTENQVKLICKEIVDKTLPDRIRSAAIDGYYSLDYTFDNANIFIHCVFVIKEVYPKAGFTVKSYRDNSIRINWSK